MTFRRSLLRFALVASSTLPFVVAACSADGDGTPVLETTGTEPGPDPVPTVALPEASTYDAGEVTDAAKDAAKDASKDAKPEASIDAGKPAPNPGDACKTLDEIFDRSCGACGKQQAICLANADGTVGTVSEYSICANELAGGCVPGTVEDEACGNCGTRKKTCTAYCAWTTTACAGEPANSCTPQTQDYSTAGCPTAGLFRTRACSETCAWSSFSLSCEPLDFQLVVAGAPGTSVSAVYPLRATMADKRLTGSCPTGTLSTTTNHPYVYVRLVNPTDQTLTLSAWNTAATTGGPVIDTLMTWYASAAKPADDAARKACVKSVVDGCPSGLPCGDTKWAGLTAANAVTLPPFGSATLFFGSYYAATSSSPSEGNVKLVVRTDAAQ